jgi:hypothetical protein
MDSYVVRVWLPDRPGALGQVASRIGAVRGDVVGIEILERGGGRAIDELVVTLPEDHLVDLLVHEIDQVDGVDVEDIRALHEGGHDPGLAAVTAAARLVDARRGEVGEVLCADTVGNFECDWAVVLQLDPPSTVAAVGEPPTASWLAAFLAGSEHLDVGGPSVGAPDDIVWARLPACNHAFSAGRKGRPFRLRERRQLAAIARVAERMLELHGASNNHN